MQFNCLLMLPLNLGGRDFLSRFSLRLLAGFRLLVTMVLFNSYSGTVISYLAFPKMKPRINSFEDLAASQEISLILLRDTVIGTQNLVRLMQQFFSYSLYGILDYMIRKPSQGHIKLQETKSGNIQTGTLLVHQPLLNVCKLDNTHSLTLVSLIASLNFETES